MIEAGEKRGRIRRKVLLPLTLTLVFFLGLFLLVSYVYLQKNIRRDLEQQYQMASDLLAEFIVQRSALVHLAIRQIAADPELQAAMGGGRREDLLRSAEPVAKELLTKLQITHFYFHSPEGVTFLRVHQPGQEGDRVTRETFRRAKRQLAAAEGIELGPLGTFSFRVVVPWFAEGRLIGFVELGEDLEHLIRKLHEVAPFEIAVFLRKSLLDRGSWEQGMRMLGRRPDWDRYPDRVAAFHSFSHLPPQLSGALNRQGFWSQGEITLEISGSTYRGKLLPLSDVQDRRVGEILILTDVSVAVENFRQSMSLVILFCLLLGGGLFASAYFLLGRTDDQLALARRQLLNEIDRAHQANELLEQEVAERRQAEIALKEARDSLEVRVRERTGELDRQNKILGNLISHIPFQVYWKDRNLRYQGCNPGFAELVGLGKAAGIAGCCDTDLLWSGDQREQISLLEATVLQTGEPVLGRELVWAGEKGPEAIFLYSLVPLKDAAGNPSGLLGLLKDITRRKEEERELRQALASARQARDRLSALVHSVTGILFAVDHEHRMMLMNASAEEFLGARLEQAIGRPIAEVITDQCLLEKVRGVLREHRADHFDLEIGGDGQANPQVLQARISVLSNPEKGFDGMIFLLQDVTQERTMDRLKSEFISTAAHELRTPIAVILGYSELLLQGPELSAEQQKDFLSVIFERADAVSNLLDDLLDISRIESGHPLALHVAPFPVRELFGGTVTHYQKTVSTHQFTLELEDEPFSLVADRGKIWQVMENLLSNAVKYSPAGGAVRVHGRKAQGGYLVTVADEGIGMTIDQVRQLFQKFYRADTSNTAIPGTGLGLTIVKHIVEAHQGKVWVESESGRGTTVSFLLPAAAEGTEEVQLHFFIDTSRPGSGEDRSPLPF